MSETIVFSPSNLATYRDCPLKFHLQRTHVIKWQETGAKSRGIVLHECMEKAVKEGVATVSGWPDGVNVAFTQDLIRMLDKMKSYGAQVMPECELVVDRNMKSCDWWSDEAFLRARADVAVITDDVAVVIDYKTGKMYSKQDFQLRVEALLLHVLYKVPVVKWVLAYCDYGSTRSGKVDFTIGLDGVSDIIDLMKKAQNAAKNSYFPAKRNIFCKWCSVYHTEHCTASESW